MGLNSGQVIAGEIGSGAFGYTAIGEQVGMAQRMESVAPPGGVMLSESTARLVGNSAALGEPEFVHIKGADAPVPARQLLGMNEQQGSIRRAESHLVGRHWEMSAVEGLLERAIDGRGAVVGCWGHRASARAARCARWWRWRPAAAWRCSRPSVSRTPAKSPSMPLHGCCARLWASRDSRGRPLAIECATAFPARTPRTCCFSTTYWASRTRMLRRPAIDPDARRRRLTALVNAASLARQTPAIFVVEDVHWIDEVSESLLTAFIAVIPQTPSLALVTYRPEYEGSLHRVHGAQTIALAPLSDSETAALVAELLGPDPSVGALATMIAERAAGNPFFAEEIVRELAERGVLRGEPGAYLSAAEVGEVSVPVTLQATIAARIDRLDPKAKRTLSAAAVIGSKFSLNLLEKLGIDPAVEHLVASQFIDQTKFTGQPEYVFHHPLIRTVAYESQLKSDRAELHRRVAAAIESRDPAAAEEKSALIAEHLEAAGDLHAAYGWHMRAATWATNRDIAAARLRWQRAVEIADAIPGDDPNRAAMRIAPRTMLCGTAWRVHADVAGDRFDELRDLCGAAGDKASLAIAMAGLVEDRVQQDRVREASQLASEAIALIESIGDPDLTVGLCLPLLHAKGESYEWSELLRWSERVIDLAAGDPSKANFIFGSPLATALLARGAARYWLGHPGWRDDLHRALAMGRGADPLTYAAVVTYVYLPAIPYGVHAADDRAVQEIEDALRIADRSGDDLAVALAQMTLGVAMVHRHTDAERDRGLQLLAEVSDLFPRKGFLLCDIPLVNVYLAREWARRGDRDEAITLLRAAVDHQFRGGQLLQWSVPATGVLVQTLLDRGDESDVAEAEAAIQRFAAAPANKGLAISEIWLLWLRALLARAHRDDAAYAHFRDRYRAMAKTHDFDGHIGWAEAMP